MNRGRKSAVIFVNNRYIKVTTITKTLNVIQHKDLDLTEFEGSLYNKFTIENIGYKIKLKDKLNWFFISRTEILPKFYKIKPMYL